MGQNLVGICDGTDVDQNGLFVTSLCTPPGDSNQGFHPDGYGNSIVPVMSLPNDVDPSFQVLSVQRVDGHGKDDCRFASPAHAATPHALPVGKQSLDRPGIESDLASGMDSADEGVSLPWEKSGDSLAGGVGLFDGGLSDALWEELQQEFYQEDTYHVSPSGSAGDEHVRRRSDPAQVQCLVESCLSDMQRTHLPNMPGVLQPECTSRAPRGSEGSENPVSARSSETRRSDQQIDDWNAEALVRELNVVAESFFLEFKPVRAIYY